MIGTDHPVELHGETDMHHLDVIDGSADEHEDPPPECLPIRGYFSFDAARADVLAELPASGQEPAARCDARHKMS